MTKQKTIHVLIESWANHVLKTLSAHVYTYYNTRFPCLLTYICLFPSHSCALNPRRPKLYAMKYNTDFWGLCFAWCYMYLVSDLNPILLPVPISLITCNSLHQAVPSKLARLNGIVFFRLWRPFACFPHHTKESLAGHFRSCFKLRQIISFIEAECYASNIIDIDDLKALLVSYLHLDNLTISLKDGSFKFCSNSLVIRLRLRGCLSIRHVDYRRPNTTDKSPSLLSARDLSEPKCSWLWVILLWKFRGCLSIDATLQRV